MNAYGNVVDGAHHVKPVDTLVDKTTDLADAGMGVNAYGTNVDMK